MTKLTKACEQAYKKLNEAEMAVQKLYKHFKFEGFVDCTPVIDYTHVGLDIFLEYKGFGIDIEQAVEIMEKHGVIKPTDFNLFIDGY